MDGGLRRPHEGVEVGTQSSGWRGVKVENWELLEGGQTCHCREGRVGKLWEETLNGWRSGAGPVGLWE